MSLTVTEPIKTVDGLLTKAIAAESQLLYGAQREDHIIDSLASAPSRVNILGDVVADFTDGDTVYIGAGANAGVWSLVGIPLFSGGITTLLVDMPDTPTDTGYINNLSTRENYRINVEVIDTVLSIKLFNQTFVYVPNQAGTLDFDVGGILSSYMKENSLFSQEYLLNISEVWKGNIPFEFTGTSVLDAAGQANLTYTGDVTSSLYVGRQVYIEFDTVYPSGVYTIVGSFYTTFTNIDIGLAFIGTTGHTITSYVPTTTLQAILAQKQILDKGGANMWENLLRIGGTTILNIDYAKQGAPTEFNAGNNTWDTISDNIIRGFLNPAFLRLNPLIWSDVRGYALLGTEAYYKITLTWIITDFIADGTVRLDFVGIDANDDVVIWNNVGLTVTGNSDNLTVTYEATVPAPEADFQLIGWQPTMSGDFSAQVRVDVSIGENIQWSSYPQAKFLTQFTNPIMWRGWNRTVGVLIDDEYVNRNGTTSFRVDARNADVNKVEGSSIGSMINESVNVSGNTVHIVKVLEGNSFFVRVRASTDGVELTSEDLYYQLNDECPNSIMLDWITSLGGVDQWLFTLLNIVNIETDAGVLAERPITTDIEFITRTKRRFARSFRQRINLRAVDLTIDQLIALGEIKHTESLRVYLTKDGSEFVDAVVIDDFNTTYEPNQVKHTIDIAIEFPDDFRFERAVKY